MRKREKLTPSSFHEISQTIDCRETGGTGCHPNHFRRTDYSFLSSLYLRFQGFWIPEETYKLCDCYGCRFTLAVVLYLS
jgi:hypothetical protein